MGANGGLPSCWASIVLAPDLSRWEDAAELLGSPLQIIGAIRRLETVHIPRFGWRMICRC